MNTSSEEYLVNTITVILTNMFEDRLRDSLTFEIFPNIPGFLNEFITEETLKRYTKGIKVDMDKLVDFINFSREARKIKGTIVLDPKYTASIQQARKVAQEQMDELMEYMNQPEPPKQSLFKRIFG